MFALSRTRVCLALAALSSSACIGTIGDQDAPETTGELGERGPVGRASFELQLTPGVQLDDLLYTITLEDELVRRGTLSFATDDHSINALFVLPPARGYALALVANTIDGATCTGNARFDIVAGRRTPIDILIRCAAGSGVGSGHVSGRFNSCPSLASITALPRTAAIGEAIELQAIAADADRAPAALSYAWYAESGALEADGSASASLRCTEPGIVAITLSVSDGDSECPGAAAATSVTCRDASEDDAGL